MSGFCGWVKDEESPASVPRRTSRVLCERTLIRLSERERKRETGRQRETKKLRRKENAPIQIKPRNKATAGRGNTHLATTRKTARESETQAAMQRTWKRRHKESDKDRVTETKQTQKGRG